MTGERESLLAISSVVPGLVPEVLLFGDTEAHGGSWMLMNFVEMIHPQDDESLRTVARRVAKLHMQSLGRTAQYGFPISTYHGKLKQFCDWDQNWETFFAHALQESFHLERMIRGPQETFDDMAGRLLRIVVPRLLGSLWNESSNEQVRPSLIHGDLWKLNCAISQADSQAVLYDPCCFWGHNECWLFSKSPDQKKD